MKKLEFFRLYITTVSSDPWIFRDEASESSDLKLRRPWEFNPCKSRCFLSLRSSSSSELELRRLDRVPEFGPGSRELGFLKLDLSSILGSTSNCCCFRARFCKSIRDGLPFFFFFVNVSATSPILSLSLSHFLSLKSLNVCVRTCRQKRGHG